MSHSKFTVCDCFADKFWKKFVSMKEKNLVVAVKILMEIIEWFICFVKVVLILQKAFVPVN